MAGRAVFVAAVLAGCGDARDLPSQLVWSSDHFDYYSRAGDPGPCPSLADVFEQHRSAVESYLGLGSSKVGRIRYTKFLDEPDATRNAPCALRGACGTSGAVHSYEAFHEHELIHAYLRPFGRPPTMFEEGIAVTLACDPVSGQGPLDMPLSWREAVSLNDPADGVRVYATGSILVYHLLRAYDPLLFMQLYGELARDVSPEKVDAVMKRLYGMSADQLWSDALAGPRGCIPVGRCSRPALATDGSPDTIGEQCGLKVDRRTFSVVTSASFVISSDSPTSFKLGSCAASSPSIFVPDATAARPPSVALVGLDAGKYFVELANAPATLAVTALSAPAIGPTCDGVTALAIVPGTRNVRIIPFEGTNEGDLFVVKLRFDAASSVDLFTTLGDVLACPGCDSADPSCKTGTASAGVRLVSPGENTLRFNYQPSRWEPAYADLVIGL